MTPKGILNILLFVWLSLAFPRICSSQISYDSCKVLLNRNEIESLKNQLTPNTFEYYYFNGKLDRKKRNFPQAIEKMNLALSFFDPNEKSIRRADALDEYGVILRQSKNSRDQVLPLHWESASIRKSLNDNSGLGLTYLFLGNVYTASHNNITDRDSSFCYYNLAINYLQEGDQHLSNIIKHNLATAYIDAKDFNKAEQLFLEAKEYFKNQNNNDYEISCALGLSDLYFQEGKFQDSELILDEISDNSIFINDLDYKGQLFQSYADIYQNTDRNQKAFAMIDSVEENVHQRLAKIELDAAEKYESQRYKNQLIEEDLISTRRMWIAISLGLLLLLASIGFYFYNRNRQQQHALKEKDLLLQKQQALEDERNRIAAEMHDDLGGGLTTIKFVSQRARRKMDNPRDQALLDKIINQSNTLVTNMSEIIWAMNSKFDNLESTGAYIRRFSKKYLDDFGIELAFNTQSENPQITLTSAVRRNILLIIKEALNNIVKHAQATHVTITINQEQSVLQIEISDNGIGLQSENKLGNGLENMRDRVSQLEGDIVYEDAEPGLRVICIIPV